MKHQQDHSVITFWRGRKGRYLNFLREAHRAHDTFALHPVQFGSAFHYEAWVLERFSRTAHLLTHQPTPVSAVINGVERRAMATFVVTRRDGSVEYHYLSRTDEATPSSRLLRRIAAANGACFVHRTRAEVRARINDFWFFEKLRQAATVWVRNGAELDETLVVLVATGPKTLVELCARIVGAPRDLIRARLARLHVAGRLVVNREGQDMVVHPAVGAVQ